MWHITVNVAFLCKSIDIIFDFIRLHEIFKKGLSIVITPELIVSRKLKFEQRPKPIDSSMINEFMGGFCTKVEHDSEHFPSLINAFAGLAGSITAKRW